jgi:hypothetical protein
MNQGRTVNEVRIVSFVNKGGHRPAFEAVLQRCLSQNGVIFVRKSATRSADFFLMIEDDVVGFIASVARNVIVGRRTVGLFFRPGVCFRRGRPKYWLKRLTFSLLRSVPRTAVLTILPFYVDPRFQQVATGWIYDPQLWDLPVVEPCSTTPSTELNDLVELHSKGRTVVVALGLQNRTKGFDRFVDIWCCSTALRDRFLFIAAGQVDQRSRSSAARFVSSGGVLLDRYISDSELLQLYSLSDFVWCCYSPDYDQSSGIFGRAFQFGKPTISRAGSLISSLATGLNHPCLHVPFEQPSQVADLMLSWRPRVPEKRELSATVHQMRKNDMSTLLVAFGCRPSTG